MKLTKYKVLVDVSFTYHEQKRDETVEFILNAKNSGYAEQNALRLLSKKYPNQLMCASFRSFRQVWIPTDNKITIDLPEFAAV